MFTKKTFIAFILTICILVVTPISVLSSVGGDEQQSEFSEENLTSVSSEGDDINAPEDTDESMNNTDNTDNTDSGIDTSTDNSNEPTDGEDDLLGNSDGSTGGTDEPIDGTGEPNGGTDELENTDEQDDDTNEPDEETDEPDDVELLFIDITVDEERNVTACGMEEIEYCVESNDEYYTMIDEFALAVFDEHGEDSFDILLQTDNPEIDMLNVDITVNLPEDWTYEAELYDISDFDGYEYSDDDENLVEGAESGYDTVVFTITPPQPKLAAPREDEPIRVESREELLSVFNTGAVSGGDFNWSGTRIVEIAFNNIGSVIAPNTPAAERTIILRSADDVQRDITVNYDTRHFNIGNRITLVIDDENLHFVGRAQENRAGGGVQVNNGASLILNGGTFKNCRASNGGGVYVDNGGTLTINDGVIENCYAVTNGGGVCVVGANALFEMYGGIIAGNVAFEGGGILLDTSSTFNMYDGNLKGNKVEYGYSGGAVRVKGNSLFNMQDGIIEDNEVLHTEQFAYGGGVCIGEINQQSNTSTFNMNGGIIRNNKAQWGGGVAAYNGFFNLGTGRTETGPAPDSQTGDVFDPIITGNEARGNTDGWSANPQIGYGGGGGVWVYDVFGATYSFVMHSGTITGNETRYRGGGVFVNRADCVILGGTISNNHTTDNANTNAGGGGVYLHTNATSCIPTLIVKNAVISGNTSRIGGGIARGSTSSSLTNLIPISILGNTVISGNTAELDGGGLHTGTPGSGTNINSTTVGTGRDKLTIEPLVKFEGNRSRQPVSQGLTVSQASINSDVFDRVEWLGKNSARGALDKPNSFHLFNNHDINNRQGAIVPDVSTLTISETTIGDFSNMLKQFDFTVTFTDSSGKPLSKDTEFSYLGSTVGNFGAVAPANGKLILDNSGSATFALGHGQSIIIEDVPLNCYVQVVEKVYDNYITCYVDSENNDTIVESNDTQSLEMTENREFNFTNERYVAPPTGIEADNSKSIIMLVLVVVLIGLTGAIVNTISRQRKQRKNTL